MTCVDNCLEHYVLPKTCLIPEIRIFYLVVPVSDWLNEVHVSTIRMVSNCLILARHCFIRIQKLLKCKYACPSSMLNIKESKYDCEEAILVVLGEIE